VSWNPLVDDFHAWLVAAYRRYGELLRFAKGEPDPLKQAALEAEAEELYDCCLALEDCLNIGAGEGVVKRLRQAIYKEMGKYQRYADALQQEAQETETDDLQAALNAATSAVCHQVLREWAEILGGG
jgi:hypothetical protein